MSHHQNLVRIRVVHRALEELGDQVVFIGGATVSLYTDRQAEEVRPTDDIDVLIEITTYKAYADVEDKLRKKGFINDLESGVICRYKVQGIVVDIMPSDEDILGFTNRWYTEGLRHTMRYTIDRDQHIHLFEAPYFLATKLDAFKERGSNDGRWSTDFEDIVYLLNNRSTIWREINNSEQKLKEYLIAEFRKLLDNSYVSEWISAHLEYAEQSRTRYIIQHMEDFVNQKDW